MQISIDTSRDSKEDILKAIHLLHSIIGEHHQTVTMSRNIFDNPQAELPLQQMMPTPQTQLQTQTQQPAQSVFGSFFDNINKQQPTTIKKENSSRVELY